MPEFWAPSRPVVAGRMDMKSEARGMVGWDGGMSFLLVEFEGKGIFGRWYECVVIRTVAFSTVVWTYNVNSTQSEIQYMMVAGSTKPDSLMLNSDPSY